MKEKERNGYRVVAIGWKWAIIDPEGEIISHPFFSEQDAVDFLWQMKI